MKKYEILRDSLFAYSLPAGFQFSPDRETLWNSLEQHKSWLDDLFNHLDKFPEKFILGVPYDTGANYVRGASFGPAFIRRQAEFHTSISGFTDLGDLKIIPQLSHDSMLTQAQIEKSQKAIYGGMTSLAASFSVVSPLSILEHLVQSLFLSTSTKLFTIGGDHSISYPIVKGILSSGCYFPDELLIVHFDAHSDLFETHNGVDYCFSTWAYHTSLLFQKPGHILQIGVRSGTKSKMYWEETYRVKQLSTSDLRTFGLEWIKNEIATHIRLMNPKAVYVTLDVDCTDESVFQSCGTPEKAGLFPIEILEILNFLENLDLRVIACDLVEFSPCTFHHQNPNFNFKSDLQWTQKYIDGLIGLLKHGS